MPIAPPSGWRRKRRPSTASSTFCKGCVSWRCRATMTPIRQRTGAPSPPRSSSALGVASASPTARSKRRVLVAGNAGQPQPFARVAEAALFTTVTTRSGGVHQTGLSGHCGRRGKRRVHDDAQWQWDIRRGGQFHQCGSDIIDPGAVFDTAT